MVVELYKKYKPRDWDSLIGQTRTVKSLRSAVVSEKIPTAFLFSGERGCGKTSAAFILAKAISCLNPPGDGNPCNDCDVCHNIDKGSQIGVNYISMANKGSAEDVREIVQQARLSSPLKKQVWILDEVHNLSKQAFDALLIPIEEEKMPSLFIFCTTEIQKVPDTILSRVQSRRFSLIPEDVMKEHVREIAKKEQLEISDEEVDVVVRKGRGSVRDTLTALDRVSETGESFTNYGGRLLDALIALRIDGALSVIAEASQEDDVKGKELAEQLFGDLRDLLLAAAGADKSLYATLPVADTEKATASLLGGAGIALALDEMGSAINQMTIGADSRIYLEVAIVKIIRKIKALKNRQSK